MIEIPLKTFRMDPMFRILEISDADGEVVHGDVQHICWNKVTDLIDKDGHFKCQASDPTHIAMHGLPSRSRDETLYRISQLSMYTTSLIIEQVLTKMQKDGAKDYLVVDLRDKSLNHRERSYYIRVEQPSDGQLRNRFLSCFADFTARWCRESL